MLERNVSIIFPSERNVVILKITAHGESEMYCIDFTLPVSLNCVQMLHKFHSKKQSKKEASGISEIHQGGVEFEFRRQGDDFNNFKLKVEVILERPLIDFVSVEMPFLIWCHFIQLQNYLFNLQRFNIYTKLIQHSKKNTTCNPTTKTYHKNSNFYKKTNKSKQRR